MGVLPRFAQRSFTRALRLKFFRTAVEIAVLSGISISQRTLGYLLNQCIARGYFARAALLAPMMDTRMRKHLIKHLLFCDQLELAEAVALLDGDAIPEQSAAYIANRLRGANPREHVYALRIKPMSIPIKTMVSEEQPEPPRYH